MNASKRVPEAAVAWIRELPPAVVAHAQVRRRQCELGLLLASRLHRKSGLPGSLQLGDQCFGDLSQRRVFTGHTCQELHDRLRATLHLDQNAIGCVPHVAEQVKLPRKPVHECRKPTPCTIPRT